MKKRMAALGCCIGMSVLLGACGAKLDVQENTIALQKSGKVLEAAVESFDQSYYDEEELNTYVQKAVEAYTQEHGKKSVSGVECFSGSIVEAQAAGYDFDLDFYPVTEGKADKKSVKGSTLLKDDDLKVLIVKANSDLIVPGKIVYVSADGTEVTSEKQVNVTQKKQDTDEAVLVYVLYQ